MPDNSVEWWWRSVEPIAQPVIERRTKGKTSLSREELEGRRLAAVKYATKYPEASLDSIERRFGLSEKTLSRKPYKDMIAKYARDIKGAPTRGKRTSVLGKKEKAPKSALRNGDSNSVKWTMICRNLL